MQVAWKNLIKPGLALLLIVIGCAVAARFLSGQETLAEYAEKNPELAYGSDDRTINKDDEAEKEASEEPDEEQVEVAESVEVTPSIPEPTPELPDRSVTEESETDASAGSGATDSSDLAGTGGSTEPTAEASDDTASDTAGTGASDEASTAASSADTADTASSSASTAGTGSTEEGAERIVYKEGFYQEKITESVRTRITGVSYPEDCPVSLDVLRHLGVKYVDFFGNDQDGEIICNERIAQELLEIFYELYTDRYPIESIRLVDDYEGDDTASMIANNTSCFNYRTVEGSTNLSRHALGLAIDINPLYNPWINYNGDGTYTVSPEISSEYADRTKDFEHKIDENDECYKLFAERDFFWGGFWNNPDYQHFQKN